MYKFAGYIAGLEILGLLGFIIVSQYQEQVFSRFLPLLITIVAVGYLAYAKAKVFSLTEISYVSAIASAIFISAFQFLGFTFYPGLAKDLDLLSEENAIRTALMLIIGTFSHILLLAVVRIGRS